MAVELMGMQQQVLRLTSREEDIAIKEAASAGIKSMEQLVNLLSSQQQQQQQQQNHEAECREATEVTMSKFKRLISTLNRTGHARFRRAPNASSSSSSGSASQRPVEPQPAAAVRVRQPLTLDFTKPNPFQQPQPNTIPNDNGKGSSALDITSFSISSSMSSGNSSFMSSITGEGSVSNAKQFFATPNPNPGPASSSGKPPLSSSSTHHNNINKKRCHDHSGSGSTRCHCSSKRRKLRLKKTIIVPAISSKIADIPADEYSWRKYGQKPIKGSPYPRGYYKCSTVRGCTARKRVERAPDDPSMLIVTYQGEHRHSPVPVPASHDNISTVTTSVVPAAWLLGPSPSPSPSPSSVNLA